MMPETKSNVVDLPGRRQETREQVLERLFKEHRAALCAFLRVRMDRDAEMDDVVQEVFIRLARMKDLPERLSQGRESNRSFIIAIANNLVLDLEKSRRVRHRYADKVQAQAHDDDRVQSGTPETIAAARQELKRLRDVIMNLNPNWRKAFILNRFKHMSYREISVEMGVSVKQIDKFMKNALIQIRRAVSETKGAGKS